MFVVFYLIRKRLLFLINDFFEFLDPYLKCLFKLNLFLLKIVLLFLTYKIYSRITHTKIFVVLFYFIRFTIN